MYDFEQQNNQIKFLTLAETMPYTYRVANGTDPTRSWTVINSSKCGVPYKSIIDYDGSSIAVYLESIVPWIIYPVDLSSILSETVGYLSWGLGTAGDQIQLSVYNITIYLNCTFASCIEQVENFVCSCNNCSLAGNVVINGPQSWSNGNFTVYGLVTVQNELTISNSQYNVQGMTLTNGSILVLNTSFGTVNGNLNMSDNSVINMTLFISMMAMVQVNGSIQFGGTLLLNNVSETSYTLFSYNSSLGSFSQVKLPTNGNIVPVLSYQKNFLTVTFNLNSTTNTPLYTLIGGLCVAVAVLIVVVVSCIRWRREIARVRKEFLMVRRGVPPNNTFIAN